MEAEWQVTCGFKNATSQLQMFKIFYLLHSYKIMIVIILQVNLFKYLLHSKLKLPYLNLREIGNDEVFIYWENIKNLLEKL